MPRQKQNPVKPGDIAGNLFNELQAWWPPSEATGFFGVWAHGMLRSHRPEFSISGVKGA